MDTLKANDKASETKAFIAKEYSKIVFIRRKKQSGLLPGQNPDEARLKIGSGYKNNAPLRGLTPIEEKRFLADVLAIDPDSREWGKEVQKYWANISKDVPPGDGLRLETGLYYIKEDDYKEDTNPKKERTTDGAIINPKGTPINLADYILWRYCLLYSRVANSFDLIGMSPKIEFYMFSKDEEVEKRTKDLKLEREALQLLYSQISDRNWADHTLRVLVAMDSNSKISLRDLENMSEAEKDINLTDFAKDNSNRFLEIGKDKNLELKSFIEEAIAGNKLQRIPNTQAIMMDGDSIGSNMQEAVAFFNNPKNAGTLTALKAQIKILPK